MPRQLIRVTVDGWREIVNDFSSANAQRANLRALNRAVITARKETVKSIRSKVRLPAREIRRVALAFRATKKKPFASVFIGSKKRFASVHFSKRPLAKGWSVSIYPGGTTKYPIAFSWRSSGRTILLQRKGKARKPLIEPVREENIRLGEIVFSDADRIQSIFEETYIRILQREIEIRDSGVV